MKKLLCTKGHIKRAKRAPVGWKKVFANCVFDGQTLCHRGHGACQQHTWKDAQRQWPLGKCELQLRRDGTSHPGGRQPSERWNACCWGHAAAATSMCRCENAQRCGHSRSRSTSSSDAQTGSPPDPAILLRTYPTEMKTYVHTKTWTWMLIAALLIRAKNWKKSKWLLSDQWISKMACSYNGILLGNKK